MATIQTRPRKDGASSYRVVWRDADKGIQSRTFTDKDKAQEREDFLDGNGNGFKLGEGEDSQGLNRADRIRSGDAPH